MIKPNTGKITWQDNNAGKLSAGWQSPSNIALVKYWGKSGHQIPINPSLSITLSNSVTRTLVYAERTAAEKGNIQLRYLFNGEVHPVFQSKIAKLLEKLSSDLPFLAKYSLDIESSNTFPHSAGIASSASSMSALALCLLSLNYQITGRKTDNAAFFRKASHLARLGSGSASRSVYGEFVLWGRFSDVSESANQYAIPFPFTPHRIFTNMCDTILIIDRGEKPVSSRTGHERMTQHFFRKGRIQQVNYHLKLMIKAITGGDWDTFSRVTENEALTLHGLMMSSDPGFLLLQANTIKAIEKIIAFRARHKSRVTYTIDAGPNLHILYPAEDQETVRKFIHDELIRYCEGGFIIDDCLGKGPVMIV